MLPFVRPRDNSIAPQDVEGVIFLLLRPKHQAMRRVGLVFFVWDDPGVDRDGGSCRHAGGQALGNRGFGVGHAGLRLAEGDEHAAAAKVLAGRIECEAPAGGGELGEQNVLGARGVGSDGDGREGSFKRVG